MKLPAALLIILLSVPCFAARSVRVKGSYTKKGTYHQPHHRTAPNRTKMDNYETKGNTNPYTGKKGTVVPK